MSVQDYQERQQALDPRHSFIVQAPAGSGKTTLLIQRFLTLLNYVNAPEEILAITFTKKAANEMRTRVIQALKEAQSSESESTQTHALAKAVLERDALLSWHLIDNPNQLRIQTIDALCAYLTKQLPILSNFGAQPGIATTPILLYQEAVQEVLTHVEHDVPWADDIATLLLHVDNDLNNLQKLLIHLLAKRDQWLPYIHFNDANDLKNQLEKQLAAVIHDQLTLTEQIFPKEIINECCALIRFAAENLKQTDPHSPIAACYELEQLPKTHVQTLHQWRGIATLLLTEKGTFRQQFNVSVGFPAPSASKNKEEKAIYADFKQRAVKFMEQLSNYDTLRHHLMNVLRLPSPHYSQQQWRALQALLNVLKITAAQLRIAFQQHGQIDFIENTQAAIAVLGTDEHPTDLALALDYQIKHILVDEFQDTSLTQFNFLEKLTLGWEPDDGRTLFVVGDPMQSIYRFREAEVGLFIRMREHGIGNLRLIPLSLSTNFRSSSQIVEWNNQHFKSIFPSINDIATGAICYHASVSGQAAIDDSNIQIHGFIDGGEEKNQANKIIDIIRSRKKLNPTEKIAILVRARQHLKTILPELKKAHLAYRAIDIDPLEDKQSIQDVFSLTRALWHPFDRIAWLSVLRAPWCGLSLADLLIIAGRNPYATLLDVLSNPQVINQLSSDGKARIERVYPILKTAVAERDRYSLRGWIEKTWLLLGGPACLANLEDMEDTQAFFELLDEFNQNHEFLTITQLKIKLKELFAAAVSQDENALQIMTIHSAKGLEFDTVILPHLERKKATDTNQLLLWMEYPLSNEHSSLLIAPIHATGNDKDSLYAFIQNYQKNKSDYEIDRLLYVATTRAKKNLFLLFDTQKKQNDNYSIESGSFLKKLWPFLEKNPDNYLSNNHALPCNEENSPEKSIIRLASAWSNPYQNPLSSVAAHYAGDGFQWRSQTPRLLGKVTHRILQLLAEKKLSMSSIQEHPSYLKRLFIQAGLSSCDIESCFTELLRIIKNISCDSRGQWIIQSHQDAACEFAITAVINGEMHNLIIDRTFIDEEGTRWIIDYKTTAFSEEDDLKQFLITETEKYAEKMQKYATAMHALDPRPIRFGLYFPALPAWHEWEYEVNTENKTPDEIKNISSGLHI